MVRKLSVFRQTYSTKFLILSSLFLLVSLLQAMFTELAGDEAYYWRYAQDLDWGYFDHPPMVAVMIKLGGFLFGGELGVRFVGILFGTASLFVLWLMVDKQLRIKPYAVELYFLLWFSLPVFNIYTFIIVPDSPLIFFSILYLFVLQRFMTKQTLGITLVLALIMALMLYSKYHGIVLIIITLIANPKLLSMPYFYLASIVGALLFVPHLLWQYEHDFATLRYHFIERNSNFSFKFIAEYPLNVLLILNPILTLIFLFKIFKHREPSEKTLRYVFWGFILFFAFSALKNHIEPHWVAVSSIPLLLLLFKISINNSRVLKSVKKASLVSIVILLTARFFLIFDVLPIKTEFHGGEDFSKRLHSVCGDTAVVFMAGYDKSARYTFDTKQIATSRSCVHFRKSQYDFWDIDAKLYGKPVVFLSGYKLGFINNRIKYVGTDSLFFYRYKYYVPIHKLRLTTTGCPRIIEQITDYVAELQIFNNYNFDIETQIEEMQIGVDAVVFLPDGSKKLYPVVFMKPLPEKLPANSSSTVSCSFCIDDLDPGVYKFAFCLKNGKMYPKKADEQFEITIK